MRPKPKWMEYARCAKTDADLHFGGPEDEPTLADRREHEAKAKLICEHCPVLLECRREVLALDQEFGVQWGVWGGLDMRARAALRRERRRALSAA